MVRDLVLTLLGLVMVFTPLALWVAWTEAIYYALLLIWFGTFGLLHLIDSYTGPSPGPGER